MQTFAASLKFSLKIYEIGKAEEGEDEIKENNDIFASLRQIEDRWKLKMNLINITR